MKKKYPGIPPSSILAPSEECDPVQNRLISQTWEQPTQRALVSLGFKHSLLSLIQSTTAFGHQVGFMLMLITLSYLSYNEQEWFCKKTTPTFPVYNHYYTTLVICDGELHSALVMSQNCGSLNNKNSGLAQAHVCWSRGLVFYCTEVECSRKSSVGERCDT